MSDHGPPHDPLLQGIEEALGQLGIHEKGLRESLLSGVREALEELPAQGPVHPHVRLIRGGREPEEPEPPRVRVTRVGAAPAPAPPNLNEQGSIALDAAQRVATQTLYRGEAVRAYRVACDVGGFEVSVDGGHAAELHPGQTLDVEGRVIRLHSHGLASGRYHRI